MIYANEDKLSRAQRVVADPSKFEAESVERVALARLDATLTPEVKVREVYKLIGGAIAEEGPDDAKEVPAQPAPKAPKK